MRPKAKISIVLVQLKFSSHKGFQLFLYVVLNFYAYKNSVDWLVIWNLKSKIIDIELPGLDIVVDIPPTHFFCFD